MLISIAILCQSHVEQRGIFIFGKSKYGKISPQIWHVQKSKIWQGITFKVSGSEILEKNICPIFPTWSHKSLLIPYNCVKTIWTLNLSHWSTTYSRLTLPTFTEKIYIQITARYLPQQPARSYAPWLPTTNWSVKSQDSTKICFEDILKLV